MYPFVTVPSACRAITAKQNQHSAISRFTQPPREAEEDFISALLQRFWEPIIVSWRQSRFHKTFPYDFRSATYAGRLFSTLFPPHGFTSFFSTFFRFQPLNFATLQRFDVLAHSFTPFCLSIGISSRLQFSPRINRFADSGMSAPSTFPSCEAKLRPPASLP